MKITVFYMLDFSIIFFSIFQYHAISK